MLAPSWSSTVRWLVLLLVAAATSLLILTLRTGLGEPEDAVAPPGGALECAAGPIDLEPVPAAAHEVTRVTHPAPRGRVVAAEQLAATPRSAKILEGVLTRPDGGPTLDAHTVVLFETDGHGAPRPGGGRVVVTPASNGRFQIQVPDWAYEGRVLIVGRARHHLPAAQLLVLQRDVPHDLVELLLEAGAVLRGRVVGRDGPIADWPVELDLRYGVPGVFDGGPEGFWLGGRFVEKHASTRTDKLGNFEFNGLACNHYDLRCDRIPPSLPSVYREVVEVDGREILVDLAGAELAIVVIGVGGHLEGAAIHVTCEGNEADLQSGSDPIVVSFPAHTEVSLRVEHASHESAAVTFTVGARGERVQAVIPMSPTVRPSLLVRLPGADEAGLKRLSLDLLPVDGPARQRRIDLVHGTALDEFWLETLPVSSGRHAVRLSSIGPILSEVKEIDVPKSGVVEIEFSGARGGRYTVSLKSSLEQWTAQWRILDDQGREVVPSRMWSADGNLEYEVWDSSSETRPTLVPDVDVLLPGRYRLEVQSEPHRARSVEFAIVAGETTRLDVQLTVK